MGKSSAARRISDEPEPSVISREPAFGAGPPSGPPVRHNAPVLTNATLGVVMMLGAEAMFFAGLIGAYLVFRLAAEHWPPPFQPRLPTGVTGANTLILLMSAFTMRGSVKAAKAGALRRSLRLLTLTAALGTVFLLVQGSEWLKLIHFGLTVSSSVYGGLFYTLIGAHGVHVLGALIWIAAVFARARRGRYSSKDYNGLQNCGMYWLFVVGLWPLLYGLVYLF